MMNDVDDPGLRILVIGCGSIGQRHIGNLIRLEAGELIAHDVDAARRDAVKSQFGVGVVASLEEAWERAPGVVLVTAPTQWHVRLAREAAQHGCHLFVEKPLSHNLDGVEALCGDVERRELVTLVGCNMRFHAGPMAVKRWLDDGVIGDVLAARLQAGSYLPRWRPTQDYRAGYSAHREWGGAVLDGIHEIDLALWFLGPGRLVGACRVPARSLGLETDGLAELIVQHESGAISNVHLNFVQRDYRRTCQIIGSQGTIYWDWVDGCVRRYGPDGECAQEIREPDGWEMNRMYVDELAHFLRAVRSGTPTVNSIRDSMASLRIALAARRSE